MASLRFLLPDLLVRADAVELLAADERAHLRGAIERLADRDGSRLLDHRVDELLVDRPLDQDAAACRADLALVEEHAEQRAFDRHLEVGVGEEDVRRLAAELERDLLQRGRGRAHDRLPDLDAPRERNLVDIRVFDDRGAGRLARAGHDVDDAGRQPGVGEAATRARGR